jgi:hypothetical protein
LPESTKNSFGTCGKERGNCTNEHSRMITEEEFQRICGPHNEQRKNWLDGFRSKGFLIGFVAVTDPLLYGRFLEMCGAEQNLSGYVLLVKPEVGCVYMIAADFTNRAA